jgi:sulfur carrier protein ThiS
MPVRCTFLLVPESRVLEYEGDEGDTYEDALLSLCINPDTVLIISGGISLPQDAVIKEEKVEIISTCSQG